MSEPSSDSQIAAFRSFTRFYTRKLGVLDQHLLKSPFSLSENGLFKRCWSRTPSLRV